MSSALLIRWLYTVLCRELTTEHHISCIQCYIKDTPCPFEPKTFLVHFHQLLTNWQHGDSDDGAFLEDIWIFSPKSVLQHCSGQVGNYHLVPSFYPTINYDLPAFVFRRPIMIIFDDDGGYLAGFDRSFHWARWLAAKFYQLFQQILHQRHFLQKLNFKICIWFWCRWLLARMFVSFEWI